MPKFLLISLTIIVGFWSLITPIFEFPDEQAHLGTVSFLSKEGRVPHGPELDMTQEMYQTQAMLGVLRNHLGQNKYTYHPEYRVPYSDNNIGIEESNILNLNTYDLRNSYVATEAARYPRLYYDYLSRWHNSVSDSDLILRSFVMRIGNTLLVALYAYILYQLGIQIFPSQKHAVTLTLLVILQPMSTYLSAGVNSDNLHNILFAGIILSCMQLIKLGFSIRNLGLVLVFVVLDIYTKPQGLIAIAVLILAMITRILIDKKWKLIFILAAIALLSIVSGWSQFKLYIGLFVTPNLHNTKLIEFAQYSLDKLLTQNSVWYWGVFKWLGVVLPPIYWQVANRLVLVSAIGLIGYFWKLFKKKILVATASNTIFLLLCTLIYTGAIYWFDYQHHKGLGYSLGVQARYLFPTISAHMALLMIGILSLTNSQKVQAWLLRSLGIFIIWMQLGGIWRLITSYYDVNSLQLFITQASQYKPAYAKGEWWYLWIALYVLSLSYLTWTMVIKPLGHTEPRVGESAANSQKPQKYGPKKSKGIA